MPRAGWRRRGNDAEVLSLNWCGNCAATGAVGGALCNLVKLIGAHFLAVRWRVPAIGSRSTRNILRDDDLEPFDPLWEVFGAGAFGGQRSQHAGFVDDCSCHECRVGRDDCSFRLCGRLESWILDGGLMPDCRKFRLSAAAEAAGRDWRTCTLAGSSVRGLSSRTGLRVPNGAAMRRSPSSNYCKSNMTF